MSDGASPAGDVIALVRDACAADPGSPAILFEDDLEVSRQELVDRVEAFAGYLRGRVRRDEPVAIAVANRAEFMIAWLAVLARGATFVSLNPAAGPADAAHVLGDSGAVMAIADPEREPLIAAVLPRCPALRDVVVLRAEEPGGLDAYAGPAPLSLAEAEVDPSAPANVYYTSGTTGPPKGCVVDHRYWLRFVELYRELYGFGSGDRLLTCLSFFYNDPSWHLLLALQSRSTFVAMRRFSVSRFWSVVRRFEITQLFGIASIPSLLLTAPAGESDRDHRVRLAVQVGIPSPEVHEQLVERWGIPWLELYGLTETGIVTAVRPEEGAASTGTGSIGTAVPGAEVRVVDEDGADVPDGEQGELLVRAPGLMLGYLNRREATAEAMRDGFFHTGDLVRRDGEGRH